MATKNFNLPSETKNTNIISDNGAQYSNLNLNQNLTCSELNPIQSNSISKDTNKDQSVKPKPLFSKTTASSKILVLFETVSQKASWNKSDQNQLSSQKFNPLNLDNDNQKKKSDASSSSNVNSSTLSLHIAAYENSIESSNSSDAQNDDLLAEKARKSKFGKTWKSVKQLFDAPTSHSFSSFEIPRQQEEKVAEPEIMQFKASQKLLNPNDSSNGEEKVAKKDMPAEESMDTLSGTNGETDSSKDFAHKQKALRTVLGISEGSKVIGMEETLPIIDALIWSLDESSLATQDDVTATVENLLHHVLSEIQPAKNGMEVDGGKLSNVFQCEYLDTVASSKAFGAIKYFLAALDRLEKINRHAGSHNEYYGHLKLGFETFFITFLRGYTSCNIPSKEITYSFTHLLLTDMISSSLMNTIVKFAQNEDLTDPDCLADIFNPVLDALRLCISNSNLSQTDDMTMEKPYYVVKSLLNIKTGTTRPFADLIACRADFCPKAYTGHRGRELSKMSFLGPFLAMGVCDIEGENHLYAGVDRYFDTEHIPQDETRFKLYDMYQGRMNNYRRLMVDIFHPILVNASTRDRALDYLSSLLKTNKKRSQIQADDNKLATDAFMVNLMCILLSLSEKVTLDKVVESYIFHPKTRVDVKDETRLKATSEEVEKYTETLDLNYEPRFPTECFFMTIHAIHIGSNPLIQSVKRVKRHLQQVHQGIRDVEEQMKAATGLKRDRLAEKLKIQKSNRDRLVRTILCMECTLRDRSILDRILLFSDRQLSFLTSMINPNYQQDFDIPDEPPKIFQMYPEFYLESVLDFVVYTLQAYPQLLVELRLNLPQQLLMFLCATHYFNNPFLAAKVVEVVYSICPEINPPMEGLFYSLVNTPLAMKKLVTSMIKFYSDLESGTDFYEKFNIRRSMQVIFRSLWKMPVYQSKIIENASQCNDEFVRFVNMVINDATYLLDESLGNLKKIHDVEHKMANEVVWNAMNDEERQRETDTLSEATRTVRSWLIMGDDTMDMFGYLTKDVPKPFYLDPLGDRVASMLNHNLSQLCGPKCTGLKVRDAVRRFHWDPRKLLEQIVSIYLNLASEEFSECVANDERSYTPEMFEGACKRIATVLPISSSERIKNLAEAVKAKWNEKQSREEDWGDIPEEFQCGIMNTLMVDPVRLPSNNVVDRKHITRHLLTEQNDPFTKVSCTVNDLVPDPALKAQIEAWVRERRNQARK